MNLMTVVRRYRTWAIGLIALCSLIYAAVFSFDIDVLELLGYLGYSVMFIALMIIAAAICVFVLKRIAVFLRRD